MIYFLGIATTVTICHFLLNFATPFFATATIATQEKKPWYIFLWTATTDTNCHFVLNFVPLFFATATIATFVRF